MGFTATIPRTAGRCTGNFVGIPVLHGININAIGHNSTTGAPTSRPSETYNNGSDEYNSLTAFDINRSGMWDYDYFLISEARLTKPDDSHVYFQLWLYLNSAFGNAQWTAGYNSASGNNSHGSFTSLFSFADGSAYPSSWPNMSCNPFYVDGVDSIGFCCTRYNSSQVHTDVISFKFSTLQTYLGGVFDTEYTSEEFGEPSTEGGYTGGTFDDSSDTISIPAMPSIGVTSAGFVNVYNPTVNALQGFGAELFPDLTFSSSSHISGSSSVADAIEAAANALVDLGNQIPNIVNMYINSNLINYVIDCHILPVAPNVGAGANIKVGFKQFTASAPVVTSDYVDFDCGTLNVGEYYANFIDYAPYTRARLFLPFVGFVDLQPEFFQSGSVNIVYRFNIIDGSFMCYVLSTSSKSKLTNSVIMQFGGNACVHIPITGLNYSSMVSGVVGGAASMVASQAGVSGLNQRAGSAITSAITSAVDVAQSKPPVQASNGYNATTSFLSVRTPYLLIERSVSNFSMMYSPEKGIPSNITSKFSELTGFTQSTAVHLDGIGATEEEKAEIAALLAQGVIL